MNKEIFDIDPFIGCPFDNSEMEIVTEFGDLKVGATYSFVHNKEEKTGEIFAIGKNAKYLDGTPFTALIVRCNGYGYFTSVTI